MAKKKPEQPTKDSYESWKKIHKFSTTENNKSDYTDVKKVREAYRDAKNARQNSCFWYQNTSTDSDNDGFSGGDWNSKWGIQEKMYLQWSQTGNTDNFQSNVKSPMTTGRIESMMHRLQRLSIQFVVYPTGDEDIGKAKIAEEVINYFFLNSDMGFAVWDWMKDSLIHGSGVARAYFKKDVRNYKFPKTKDINEEEEKDIEDGKVVYGPEEEVIKYKGLVLEPIPIQEMYFDPQARSLHGHFFSARFAVRRKVMNIDDFKVSYKYDKNAKNVDKVKPKSFYSGDYEFFKPPEDLEPKDVEVLEYENEIDDEYILIANDMVIKSQPLPYSHKELTYIMINPIRFLHQLYGIGIPDFLEQHQGSQEILMNMIYDYLYKTIDIQYMVDTSIFGEFTKSAMRAESKFIPVSVSAGENIGNKVMQLPHQPVGFDAFRMFDITNQNGTLASNIDPSQMSLVNSSQTATSTMVNKELADALLNSVVRNFSIGLTVLARQVWAIIKQMYSEPEIKEIINPDGQKEFIKKFMQIRLEGKQIVADEEGINVEVKNSDDPFNFFEVKGDYLQTTNDLDIRIAPETMEIMSKALERQKFMEAFAQLMPLAANPDNPTSTQNPNAYIDGNKLVEEYLRINNMPEDLAITAKQDTVKDLFEAKQHVNDISAGMNVYGEPGASPIMRSYESKVLGLLNNKVKELQESIDKQMMVQPPQFDEMGQPIEPLPDPQLSEEMEGVQDFQKRLAEHLAQHNAPAYMIEEQVLEEAAAQNQPPQDPMMGQVPMPAGSNMPIPNMQGGGVPMIDPGQMGGMMPGMGAII